ncbi:hypothetical protein PRZ48_007245 [Zasmidium cellare]|uniref:N-acetyl-D-glucosamine kinase n=1 Tax=Zasmidium cellare TaxID=395010 RepID=A0ABR0EIT5_ZASCE|nr:hypothetical protein PRZ48_007245 [Zasmidium cellare]
MSAAQQPLDLTAIQTESRNRQSTRIDEVSTRELCRIINEEDKAVPGVVEGCIPNIAKAIDALAERVRNGGRIFYIGAGTSGRLGVLDASEIPPTYSAPPEQFVGLIAGGDVALRSAIEGAEDDAEAAVKDLKMRELDGEKDCLIGIAASGRTPYVLGGLAWAKRQGCVTVGVACSNPSAMSRNGDVDFMIEAVTGAEVVTGSTRMKAGTATKLVLNMISTGVMIKIGKTYGNIMIDVKPTNVKLKQRARGFLREICGHRCPVLDEALDATLEACGRSVKLAAVVIWFNIPVAEAQRRLDDANGVLANALQPPRTPITPGRNAKTFYLCVDGGGTKTHAVITSFDGLNAGGMEAEGNAGPCNATEIGVDTAVSQIMRAANEAIAVHDDKDLIRETGFKSAWVAMAGLDRTGLREILHKALQDKLPLQPEASLQITNDIELIAADKFHEIDYEVQRGIDNVIVLVAGTGSVAMTYHRVNGRIVRTDRSGGWGALLGDNGSGFDIGRQALRLALADLEDRKRLDNTNGEYDIVAPDTDPLTQAVMDHFGPVDGTPPTDLLSAVMMPNPDDAQGVTGTKRRIASCAKVVAEVAKRSARARAIIDTALRSLMALVQSLLRADIRPDSSTLVLAGGLMQSGYFREGLKKLLLASGIDFWQVGYSAVPAWGGGRYLASVDDASD